MRSEPLGEAAAARLRFILLPQFGMMSLNAVLEPIRVANYLAPAPLYQPSFHSFDGDRVAATNGMQLPCAPPPERVGGDELVFVFASWGGERYRDRKLMSWCRLQARHGVRLCAVEMAAYVFARAGLLAGRRATTQWSMLPGLREEFPNLDAVEQLFTIDGPMMTCAGGTAGLDLMLHLIGEVYGNAFAGEIADQLLHHPIRPGSTPQRAALGRDTRALPASVRAAVELIHANIPEPLSVPQIAVEVGISQRQLERQFGRAIGCSVVQFSLLTRLQHARVLLISTQAGVREIAAAAGFNSLSHFAFAFKKCFGKRPSEYRQAWPTEEAAPQWPGTLARFLDEKSRRRRVAGQGSDGLA